MWFEASGEKMYFYYATFLYRSFSIFLDFFLAETNPRTFFPSRPKVQKIKFQNFINIKSQNNRKFAKL